METSLDRYNKLSGKFTRNKLKIKKILKSLEDYRSGLAIDEVSRVTGLNRWFCSKYLNVLYVAGIVKMQHIGKAKVYMLKQTHGMHSELNDYG